MGRKPGFPVSITGLIALLGHTGGSVNPVMVVFVAPSQQDKIGDVLDRAVRVKIASGIRPAAIVVTTGAFALLVKEQRLSASSDEPVSISGDAAYMELQATFGGVSLALRVYTSAVFHRTYGSQAGTWVLTDTDGKPV